MSYYKNPKEMYTEDFIGNTLGLYTEEGGNFYNLVYPFYMRISYLTQLADEVTHKTNMTDALKYGYSSFVDKRADELGLVRKEGTYAKFEVKLTGKPNYTTSNNIVVGTKDNRLYYSEGKITFDSEGKATVEVTAENPGALYNVKAGEVTEFPVKYANIISVTNEKDYNEAYDEESDEFLANRYYLALQNNKTSGNVAHYRSWCLEVTGCNYCKVVPLWDGNGTVKCVIANANKRSASPELIQQVKDHVAKLDDGTGKAPIGADLTVVSYTEKTIDIDLKVLLDTGYELDKIKEIIKLTLETHFKEMDIDSNAIRIFDVYKALSKIEGILDISEVKLNNATSTITLTDEIPVLGTLTVAKETV